MNKMSYTKSNIKYRLRNKKNSNKSIRKYKKKRKQFTKKCKYYKNKGGGKRENILEIFAHVKIPENDPRRNMLSRLLIYLPEDKIQSLIKYEKKNDLDLAHLKKWIHIFETRVIYGERLENGDIYDAITMNISGTIFEGSYKNGFLSGKVKVFFHNGDKYEGDFENSMKNGFGKQTYADGSYYNGSFVDNKREGLGKYVGADVDKTNYEGNWKHGRRHGYGRQTNNKGEIYEGNFYKGKRQGQGTMIYGDKKITRLFTDYDDYKKAKKEENTAFALENDVNMKEDENDENDKND